MAKTVLIIQARMSSRRLPGKMLRNIAEIPLYEYVYRRCQQVQGIDSVVLATSDHKSDDAIVNSAKLKKINIFRGSLSNVLERYIACAQEVGADTIVRVCGDSPFVDVHRAKQLLTYLNAKNLDYISFAKNRFVKGLDSEAFRLSALQRSLKLNDHPDNLEHVTYYIRQNFQIFKAEWIDIDMDPFDGRFSLTVDTAEDLEFCQQVANAIAAKFGYENFDFTTLDVFRIIQNMFGSHKENGQVYA